MHRIRGIVILSGAAIRLRSRRILRFFDSLSLAQNDTNNHYQILYNLLPFSVVMAWISSTVRPRIWASFSAIR